LVAISVEASFARQLHDGKAAQEGSQQQDGGKGQQQFAGDAQVVEPVHGVSLVLDRLGCGAAMQAGAWTMAVMQEHGH
jgi:hypothetical protein